MSRLEGELAGVAELVKARTLDYATGLVELTGEQLVDLAELADDAAEALAGDERALAHLEAQLAAQAFSAQARAYLESLQFRKALAAALVDVAQEMAKDLVTRGAQLAAKTLAEALISTD